MCSAPHLPHATCQIEPTIVNILTIKSNDFFISLKESAKQFALLKMTTRRISVNGTTKKIYYVVVIIFYYL